MSEDHSADRTRLLALVPADGTAVGNTALIRQLGWAENRYWYARDSLLEAGVIHKLKHGLKILGTGELKKAITVKAHVFSKSALDKIQAAGGTAEVITSDKISPEKQ